MRLLRFRELPPGGPMQRAGLALFRRFIDEQGQLDPIYRWEGGDDSALQRTWGGWEQLHLYVDGEQPIGTVSCMSSDYRLLPLAEGAGRGRHSVTLTNLYVHPDARGRGHGRRMVSAFLEVMRATPPRVQLGGGVATHVIAATHGWNRGGQAVFEATGFTPVLASHAIDHAAFAAQRSDVEAHPNAPRVDEASRLDPALRAHLAGAWSDPESLSASWYEQAHGLRLASKADHLFNEALFTARRPGGPTLLANFAWSLNTLPGCVVVECLELHATPAALLDRELVQTLHARLGERLATVHQGLLGEPLDGSERIVRLPLLVPADHEQIRATLLEWGLELDLLYYAQPL